MYTRWRPPSRPNRRKPILIFVAATLLLYAIMSTLTDFPLLDMMWRPTAEEIHQAASALTAEQIQAYRTMLTADFLFAIAYTGLLVLLFRYFGSNQRFRGAIHRAGIVAAATAGLSDYLENGLILAVLATLPGESPVASVLGAVTTLKWIAVATAAGLFVVMLLIPKRRP